jgi:hypothetical protein
LPKEPLAKVSIPVILRKRSDRRISKVAENARSFAALRMTKRHFASASKVFSVMAPTP